MLAILKKGLLRYEQGGVNKEVDIEEGFVEVLPEKVRILVEGCEECQKLKTK